MPLLAGTGTVLVLGGLPLTGTLFGGQGFVDLGGLPLDFGGAGGAEVGGGGGEVVLVDGGVMKGG